jgi:hypothetical protein
MSQASNQSVKSFIAGESFASKQFYAVMMTSTNNTVVVAGTPAAEGTHVIGIIQNEPASGEAASVVIGGTSKLVMAANCSIGEKIMSSSGKGTPVDADTKSVIGIALEANAAGDGTIIEVLVTPGGVAQADESN